MMHKAWSSIEEVPYYFSRSSVKFQGHIALKIGEFDSNWAFPDCNSSLNSPMAMKCCTMLETAKRRCPIVFQGHPSTFKVTRDKTSPILTQIGHYRTIGRSQLSNPSDLPCFTSLGFIYVQDYLHERKGNMNSTVSLPVAHFTREVNLRLDKLPFNFNGNGGLAKHGLTSLVMLGLHWTSKGLGTDLRPKNDPTLGYSGVGRQGRMFLLCYSPEGHKLLLNTRNNSGLLAIEIDKIHDHF